ncbi:ABC transporter substrate-binding protein [Thioclava sp. GXIMD2076]|uniref:ABC transporter substrate-binding protein n=1 Tax=Thioclava sp. GXIMD2076 TaxID=3131931 RepID=UPI0030CB52C6
MFKLPKIAALSVALVAPLAAHAQCTPAIADADLIDAGKLQLSINPTNPPQQFVDKDGKLQGLNVDLADEISKRVCVDVELVRMDFPAMIPAMKGGRIDGMNTGMFWTEERSKMMWTVPYSEQSIAVIAKPGSDEKLSSETDLEGKTVGVETNSYQQNWLKKLNETNVAAGKKEIEIRGFATASAVVAALQAGQVDNALVVDSVGADLVKREKAKEVLTGLGKTRTTMAFANKNVADAVVKAMDEMQDDGTYQALFDKWKLSPLPEGEKVSIAGPGPSN